MRGQKLSQVRTFLAYCVNRNSAYLYSGKNDGGGSGGAISREFPVMRFEFPFSAFEIPGSPTRELPRSRLYSSGFCEGALR